MEWLRNPWIVGFLLALPAVAVFVRLLALSVAGRPRDWSRWFMAVVITAMLTAALSLPLRLYEVWPVWGVIQYAVVLACVIFLIWLLGSKTDSDVAAVAGLVSLFLPVVLTVGGVGFLFVSPPATPQPEPKTTQLSTKPFTESLRQIRLTLEEAEKRTSAETKNVDQAIARLTSEIEAADKALKQTQAEQARLAAELEEYKKLASLSKEQAEAVTRQLERSKYFDYMVGFVSALAVSALFFIIPKVRLPRKAERKQQDKSDKH